MAWSFFSGAVCVLAPPLRTQCSSNPIIHTTNQAVICSYLYLDQTYKSDSNNHSHVACAEKQPC